MFARSVQGGCSDSTAVLDRESNAFSSCAIMLLLRAAAAVAGASQRALYWRRGRESTPSLHVSERLHVISQESRYVPEINSMQMLRIFVFVSIVCQSVDPTRSIFQKFFILFEMSNEFSNRIARFLLWYFRIRK